MSISSTLLLSSNRIDVGTEQYHQVLSKYSKKNMKLPGITNQTDRSRAQRQFEKNPNDSIYCDLVRHLQNKQSPKIELKHIMQTKKQESLQQQIKKSIEQTRQSQIFLLDQFEMKKIGGDLQASSQRIQKMQNQGFKRIGLYTLKNLNKESSSQSSEKQNNSTFSRKYIEDQSQFKNILCSYIDQNKKYFNKEIIQVKSYEKSAPFKVEQLKFVETILPHCQLVQKTLGYNEDNLKRNKMILEKILLERMLLNERNNLIE